MSTAAIVGGTIAAAGISSGASLIGAGEQAGAAKNAQQLQAQEAQNALNFQEQEFNTTQANDKPFLQAGTGAVNELSSLTSTPGQGLLTPWTQNFQAPTAAQAEQTPGYQFQLQQGEQALQNSAAANGGLLAGGTGKALTNYAEGVASTNYQNTFNNALTQYQTAYNTFQNNQANTYNRLAGLAGTGQTTAAQLGNQGQAAANNQANISLTTGAQQGADIQNAAYQTASGYTGAANAFTGATSNLSGLLMLQNLLGNQSSAFSGAPIGALPGDATGANALQNTIPLG